MHIYIYIYIYYSTRVSETSSLVLCHAKIQYLSYHYTKVMSKFIFIQMVDVYPQASK